MSLFWHQLRAEQLTTWRSREAVIFVFLFPPLLFVLLASVFGDGIEDGRRVSSYLVAGLIGYAVANTALGGLAITLVIRREYGLLKRLRSTPLPGSVYLATVLASNLLIVVLQSLTVIALGVLLFDSDLPERALSFVLVLAIGAACFAGLGLAAAALIRSADAVAAVVNVIVLPMSFLSGAFGTTDNLPRRARARRRRPAAQVPDRARARDVRRRRPDLEAPRRGRRHGGLGRRRLRRRPRPLRLGAARTLEDFRSGVGSFAMQKLAPIAFLDEDGDIRVNFGLFAGREATRAEIDDLAQCAPGGGRRDHDRRRAAHDRRSRDGGVRAPDPDRAERGRPAATAPDRGAVGRSLRGRASRRDHRGVSTLERWPAAPISATSRSSRTSTMARPRSSTRCSGSPAPFARTRTSTSGSSTRWTSSARRGSRSWPRTRPSATARRRSTSSTRRAMPTSAARSSAG